MNQTFQVTGMTCGHCERAVKSAVNQLDPNAEVTVDLPSGRVSVTSNLPRENLAQAIAEEGYAVVP